MMVRMRHLKHGQSQSNMSAKILGPRTSADHNLILNDPPHPSHEKKTVQNNSNRAVDREHLRTVHDQASPAFSAIGREEGSS